MTGDANTAYNDEKKTAASGVPFGQTAVTATGETGVHDEEYTNILRMLTSDNIEFDHNFDAELPPIEQIEAAAIEHLREDDHNGSFKVKNTTKLLQARISGLHIGGFVKRAAIIAAVALICASAGFFGVRFITPLATGKTTEGEDVSGSSYGIYDFDGLVRRASSRNNDGGAPYAEDNHAEYADSTDEPYNVTIINLLYPVYIHDNQTHLSDYNNHIKNMTDRMSANAADNLSILRNDGLSQDNDAPAPHIDGHSPAPVAAAFPPNPTIPVNEPFTIEVLSFRIIDGILMSGNLRLFNNTDFEIDNAFFEITMRYEDNGDIMRESRYAYVNNVNLGPDDAKIISYAAVPPDMKEHSHILDGVTLAAFDTFIDGEPFRIYFNSEQSYLEALAVDAY
jgi:hypothetical protein